MEERIVVDPGYSDNSPAMIDAGWPLWKRVHDVI
jgi:hypothetical protein